MQNNFSHHPSVLITGASSGIGEATAIHLSQNGFRVFAGVRNFSDGERLKRHAKGIIHPVLLDVTQKDSIAFAYNSIKETVGKNGLAGLINNAGIAIAGPIECIPIEEIRRQMEVNVIGQISVTQTFLPLLKMNKGKIVNIGSVSGRMTIPFLSPYSISKFAMEAFTDALRMELRQFGISVSIIETGNVATPIWKKSIRLAETFSKNPL